MNKIEWKLFFYSYSTISYDIFMLRLRDGLLRSWWLCVGYHQCFTHRHREFFLCNCAMLEAKFAFIKQKKWKHSKRASSTEILITKDRLKFISTEILFLSFLIDIPLRCRGNIEKQMIVMCCQVMMINTLLPNTNLFTKISGDHPMINCFRNLIYF